MISYCIYDIMYDIISFWPYHSHLPVSCAIFLWYCLRYHIHIIRNLLWYQNVMIWLMTSEHIRYDKALWYHYVLISWPCDITDFMICSPISWHLRGGLRGLGPQVGGASRQALHLLRPRHCHRAGESVGTVVHLNSDGLDPAHGLVAVAAAKFQV